MNKTLNINHQNLKLAKESLLSFAFYGNGRIAMLLKTLDGAPLAHASVNLVDRDLHPDEVFLKAEGTYHDVSVDLQLNNIVNIHEIIELGHGELAARAWLLFDPEKWEFKPLAHLMGNDTILCKQCFENIERDPTDSDESQYLISFRPWAKGHVCECCGTHDGHFVDDVDKEPGYGLDEREKRRHADLKQWVAEGCPTEPVVTNDAPTGPVDGAIAFTYGEKDGTVTWVQVSGKAATMKRQNPQLDHGVFVRMLEADKTIRQGMIHKVRTFY